MSRLRVLYRAAELCGAFSEACEWAETISLCWSALESNHTAYACLAENKDKVVYAVVGKHDDRVRAELLPEWQRHGVWRVRDASAADPHLEICWFVRGERARILVTAGPFVAVTFEHGDGANFIVSGESREDAVCALRGLMEHGRMLGRMPWPGELEGRPVAGPESEPAPPSIHRGPIAEPESVPPESDEPESDDYDEYDEPESDEHDEYVEAVFDEPDSEDGPAPLCAARRRGTAAPEAPASRPSRPRWGQPFEEMELEDKADAVWHALVGRGAMDDDDAVRTVAETLREMGQVEYERLRRDGSLWSEIQEAIRFCIDEATMDRPQRRTIRAIIAKADDFDAGDWRNCLIAGIGDETISREEAMRAAFVVARMDYGLAAKRLRSGGKVDKALRSAINSAIRRGLIVRVGANDLQRADSDG